MNSLERPVASVSGEVSSQASLISGVPLPALSTSWTPLRESDVSLRVQEMVPSPMEPLISALDLQAAITKAHSRIRPTKRVLADALRVFCSEGHLPITVSTTLKRRPLPLEQTEWSQSQLLDLFYIDVLNFFSEKQQAQLQNLTEEEVEEQRHLPGSRLGQLRPNIVVRPPRERWCA